MTKPAYRTYPVRVAHRDQLTPSFVRVRFTSPELADLGREGPDQRIKVILPLPESGLTTFPTSEDWYGEWRLLPDNHRNPIRTYTIRDADPAAHELTVDFVAHGDSGPASRWINRAAVGDEVLVIAPDATSDQPGGGYEWLPGKATTLLLAGDETAVPAISAILESLAADATGAAFLEVPTAADILDLRAPTGIPVSWLPRDGFAGGDSPPHGVLLGEAVRTWAERSLRPAEASRNLAERSRNLAEASLGEADDVLWEVPDTPTDPGLYAWIAGEAGAVTGLRRFLVKDLGVERSRVAFMGYWKQGRAEN